MPRTGKKIKKPYKAAVHPTLPAVNPLLDDLTQQRLIDEVDISPEVHAEVVRQMRILQQLPVAELHDAVGTGPNHQLPEMEIRWISPFNTNEFDWARVVEEVTEADGSDMKMFKGHYVRGDIESHSSTVHCGDVILVSRNHSDRYGHYLYVDVVIDEDTYAMLPTVPVLLAGKWHLLVSEMIRRLVAMPRATRMQYACLCEHAQLHGLIALAKTVVPFTDRVAENLLSAERRAEVFYRKACYMQALINEGYPSAPVSDQLRIGSDGRLLQAHAANDEVTAKSFAERIRAAEHHELTRLLGYPLRDENVLSAVMGMYERFNTHTQLILSDVLHQLNGHATRRGQDFMGVLSALRRLLNLAIPNDKAYLPTVETAESQRRYRSIYTEEFDNGEKNLPRDRLS